MGQTINTKGWNIHLLIKIYGGVQTWPAIFTVGKTQQLRLVQTFREEVRQRIRQRMVGDLCVTFIVPTVSFDKERDFQNEEFYFSDSKYW